jgi:uncharacterized protein (TIGR00255 family)
MTGFGSASGAYENISFNVEIRGVNSRYLETSVRMPRFCNFAEDAIKKAVQASVQRGKVEISVTTDSRNTAETVVTPNLVLAAAYIDTFRQIANECAIPNDFGTAALSRLPDVFTVTKKELDADLFTTALISAVNEAVSNFLEMRGVEGEKLAEDILLKFSELESLSAIVKSRSPASVREYREKLTAKMLDILKISNIDESKILTEAALFADKVDVDEELTRLSSHISQGREMLRQTDGVGRKLDFLIQELNREVNTIGSKCVDLEITRTTLDMKAVIEKIREQCQNLE